MIILDKHSFDCLYIESFVLESSSPHYITVSKELILEKLSQTFANSQSSPTKKEIHPSIVDEPSRDGHSSSSPLTSVVHETEDDHRSSSSKIYQEYKKRTSSSSTNIARCHSMLMHPIHTRIGLRSSTSSSTNDKLSDMTLVGKQMNVCVINQLNEHLSTRFSQQQQQKQDFLDNTQTISRRQSYDLPPPPEEFQTQSHVYDEPSDVPMSNETIPSSIPPPPPPPPP